MSYDLYFYKGKVSNLTEAEVARYFTETLPHCDLEFPRQWSYENPDTGVYFTIDWSEPESEEEDIALFEDFSDFDFLHFTFSINFFRPTYFAFETFPLVEKWIRDLNLFVLNGQDETDSTTPREFTEGYLSAQWIRHNDMLSLQNFEELKFQFFPLDKSIAFWRFQSVRSEFEKSIREDIYVPNQFILKKSDDGELYTAISWPTHIPILLPPVDFVVVQKKYRKLFRTIEENGFVAYAEVLTTLGHYFEDFSDPIPGLKLLRQGNADKMKDDFNQLQIATSIQEFGTLVGRDGFVNVRP